MSAPSVTGVLPAVVAGLCDDAAVFPPGLAPLPDAVRAHQERVGEWYADLAGPLVLSESAVPRLGPLVRPGTSLRVSVTLPGGPAGLRRVLGTCARLPVALSSVEVVVPEDVGIAEFFTTLAAGLEGAEDLDVYVEVPRDERRTAVLAGLRGRYRAKFRTGGVRADLYPDEAELAAALAAVVEAGVAFKATAGLHHAVRNTDPETGFEQHGFLNLLLATHALLAGDGKSQARALLAERDAATVAARVRALDAAATERVRTAFISFGTCSITAPLTELIDLDVVRVQADGGSHS